MNSLIDDGMGKMQGKAQMPGGKKEDQNYAQISGHVPKDLAKKFKAECTMVEISISSALEAAIEVWMELPEEEKAKAKQKERR